jgi:hypothetical protein
MQERQHVKTVPGEMKAPEVIPHPVRREDGHDVQTDDINIPMVAIFVVFFAVLLSVVIISLQAWFYGYQESERAQKLESQESPRTALGSMLQEQRAEIHDAGLVRAPAATGPAPATNAAATNNTPRKSRVPIDEAMKLVINEYARSGGAQGSR